ncbi:MAG: TIGR03936 family radical SAM-associated protein [Peptostreptococcaceae bacterium]
MIFRVKFNKEDDMIYISHLDIQKVLQRAFRRAGISLVHSQGFNPHPKISYGNALALGTESQGEYFDVETCDDMETSEFLDSMNNTLPKGIKFLEAKEITSQEQSLAKTIEYGEYLFTIELEKALDKNFVKERLLNFLSQEEILITKKNKKGKMVESDIRPMIKVLDLVDLNEEKIIFEAILSTGSKANLNTSILIPKLLEMIDVEIDPLDVDILRRDLFKLNGEELENIM